MTERLTGIVWSYRIPGTTLGDSFHGTYETRHEAIGHATRLANLMDADEWEVRWHESLWREMGEPTVCGYCDHEENYLPLVRWTFASHVDASPFCSTECYARHCRKNDIGSFAKGASA